MGVWPLKSSAEDVFELMAGIASGRPDKICAR